MPEAASPRYANRARSVSSDVSALYVGVMSGTSLDGVDAALVDLSSGNSRVIATATVPFEEPLRSRLTELCQPGRDGLDAASECAVQLARVYAEATLNAVRAASIDPSAVSAIGCHGQTVRHRPERGFTVQLNDPALLAELTGIDVVADFRRRDMAAGGQGAPLVPLFHDAVFRDHALGRVIVNIGGISNATVLHPGKRLAGFDCGPGNLLLDHWAATHRGEPFDRDGAWARTGHVLPDLLSRCLQEDFFEASPPKSTGRERFNPEWLSRRLSGTEAPEDVQATLLELTIKAIIDAIDRFAPGTNEVYLCGGGAHNTLLRARMAEATAPRAVATTEALGIAPQWVEATAFAWLADRCLKRVPLPLPSVTGARHDCVLGAIYPR